NDMKWNDLGNGQVLVVVEGEGFTPDTTIVSSNSVLSGPEKGLTVANERRLIVVTQGQLLAQSPSPATIVGRYGTTEFVRARCLDEPAPSTGLVAGIGSGPSAAVGDTCGGNPFHEINYPYADLQLTDPTIRARDSQTVEVNLKLIANS